MSNPRKVAQILATEPSLAALRERLENIARLQRLCRQWLPRALAGSVSVGEPVGNELRLFADNGAAAAKLRHLTPELLAVLSREGWQFTVFRVAVQVRTTAGLRRKNEPKQIDEIGRVSLTRLADGLGDTPLKEAVQRLLRGNTKRRT